MIAWILLLHKFLDKNPLFYNGQDQPLRCILMIIISIIFKQLPEIQIKFDFSKTLNIENSQEQHESKQWSFMKKQTGLHYTVYK